MPGWHARYRACKCGDRLRKVRSARWPTNHCHSYRSSPPDHLRVELAPRLAAPQPVRWFDTFDRAKRRDPRPRRSGWRPVSHAAKVLCFSWKLYLLGIVIRGQACDFAILNSLTNNSRRGLDENRKNRRPDPGLATEGKFVHLRMSWCLNTLVDLSKAHAGALLCLCDRWTLSDLINIFQGRKFIVTQDFWQSPYLFRGGSLCGSRFLIV